MTQPVLIQHDEIRTKATSRHATAVAVDGRALLITGSSGAGKSTLALEMIALGAGLISDDQVMLIPEGGAIIASAPVGAPALIEVRGMGLVSVGELAPPTPVALILDLDVAETERLPQVRSVTIFGVSIRILRKPEQVHGAALLLALRGGGLAEIG